MSCFGYQATDKDTRGPFQYDYMPLTIQRYYNAQVGNPIVKIRQP